MPADAETRAYLAGLKLLAVRELAESQVRDRLRRRGFTSEDIDQAIWRLRQERALDDRRAAGAYARTETHVRGRGRLRVLRRLQSIGIAPELAREAVADAFRGLDETDRIDRLLNKRLRQGDTLDDPRVVARVYRYLVAQGFSPDEVSAALRRHRTPGR